MLLIVNTWFWIYLSLLQHNEKSKTVVICLLLLFVFQVMDESVLKCLHTISRLCDITMTTVNSLCGL